MDTEEGHLPYIDHEYNLPGMKDRVNKLLEEEMRRNPYDLKDNDDKTPIEPLELSNPPKFNICPEAEYEMLCREEISLLHLLNLPNDNWDKEIAKLEQKYEEKKQELKKINEEIMIIYNQRREIQEKAEVEFQRLRARAAFNANQNKNNISSVVKC